jgi:hypothetical protein
VERWRSISAEAIEKLRGMGIYSDETISKILSLLETYRSESSPAE